MAKNLGGYFMENSRARIKSMLSHFQSAFFSRLVPELFNTFSIKGW